MVAASYAPAGAMDDFERRLRIVVPEAAGVYVLQTLRGYVVARRTVLYGGVVCAYDVELSAMLLVPLVVPLPSLAASVSTKSGSMQIFASAIWRSQQSRRVVVKLDDEVMGRGVAVCEVGEIVKKGLSEVGLRTEDVVLSPAAIALAVPEEREEEEGGKRKWSERLVSDSAPKVCEKNKKDAGKAGRSDGAAGCGGA
ncbi:uncharacterized protein MONOS_13878 [Monocercomonoides exilis]|uniref:uncharacterized protein n=1 Tax=Monocercomonoides exilis TaxID=2049356 RepID=UPI00355A58E8|nr:hypothetical protein MONOS_13878 [Monocercomonoides exilis]|eukprot:MONOS_13878.1-p1 / transcript=MONOS_13878.1 / gene=MONOS_13878 / organism=Monocercomonoides_exilis_PA203 / gene_product=unspecified product / transcript_product=unspecified product / location=Mono_scaffold00897:15576-16216(-) / protein_length=197 / sequence_SO=supercontig / SO=protein_coding / is_pseudo=false